MLVLTRKLQEQISIGQDITITILRIKGNTVRIGIEAPSEVRVVRGELPRHDTPRSDTQRTDTQRSDKQRSNTQRSTPAETAQPHHHLQEANRSTDSTAKGGRSQQRTRTPGLKPMVERFNERNGSSHQILLDVAAVTAALVD